MRSLPASPTTRRTVVRGLLAGLVVLTGCDAGGDGPRSQPSTFPPSGATGDGGDDVGGDDADAVLLDRVIAEIDELDALVRAAVSRHRALAPRFAGLRATHEAHRAALAPGEPSAARGRVRGTTRQVADQVLRREEAGRDRLAAWALDARSGALARLLASMSAGIAAQLAHDAAGGSR